MKKSQKISLLNSWKVAIPSNATEEQINSLFDANRKSVREMKNKFGKISVQFDKSDETPVEVMIYQDIGDDPWGATEGFTSKSLIEILKDVDNNRPLDIRINSAGGSVWEGLAIKSRIDEWKGRKTAAIDGIAASVASWLPMSVDEIRAPRHAQMFIHDAWGMCMGNSQDMRKQADDLEKTSEQIAEMYATRAGGTVSEWRDRMKESSLFTAEEANKLGLIDRITDDEPVQNFSAIQIRNMKAKLATLNNIKQLDLQSEHNQKQKHTMNRKQKIALLNKWGVSVSKGATNAFIDSMLNAMKAMPEHSVKFKNEKDGEHSDECACDKCSNESKEDDEPSNAPEPSAEKPDADDGGAKTAQETVLWKAASENKLATDRMNKFLETQRRNAIQSSLDKLVSEGRLPANELKGWFDMATSAIDSATGENPIVSQLNKTLPAVQIGVPALNIDMGDSDSITDLDKTVNKLMESQAYFSRNSRGPDSASEKREVANSSKEVSRIINRLKKFEGGVKKNSVTGELPQVTGPLIDAWNKWAASPRNVNTISAGLQRQVILSEVMRAFRRQFASLEIFSHNFGNIPLEGTDYVQVPYYPLDTTSSSEFTQSGGYSITPSTQTNSKSIFVGGKGDGVASPGCGRKYKGLNFSAYQIRRQPWLDIQKLSVMAGEQLAIDVRADILGTQISAANFGNAIWTGNSGGFDHTVIGQTLLQAAINAYWPLRGRNIVLAPSYYTNLAVDPGITPLLAIGTTDVLREGIVGGLYGFENIIHDPLLPIATNAVRGGDGTSVAGADPFSAGFMAWPSAILIATAPIMPPPGVLKKLVSYEQITDDQTGLAFTYQFWGDESKSADNEIIECCYGSGLGELKALFRLTSQGV